MAFDKRTNFAYSTVKVAPSPATTGTSLTVQTGDGAKFNATPPYNAVVFPSNANPSATNAEVVRVTAISTDTFTITRTQEGSTARSIATGDQIIAGLTDKTLSDIETLLTSTTTTTTSNTTSITTINNLLNGTNTGVILNTPTIANLTNVQHTHASASQGGAIGVRAILSAMLGLSSGDGGGVASIANAGTAGGTMYYINLGGIKLLWGTTSSLTAPANSSSNYTITYPTSFFTTIQLPIYSLSTATVSVNFNGVVGVSYSASTATFGVQNETGATGVGGSVGYFVVGT